MTVVVSVGYGRTTVVRPYPSVPLLHRERGSDESSMAYSSTGDPAMGRHVARVMPLLALAVVLVACGRPAGFGGAEDIQREIDTAKATTPLPPGATFSPIKLMSGADYQGGSGTSMIQFQAACAWFGYWADAITSGDANAEAQASAMADQIRTWQTYVTSDISLRSAWDSMIDQARLGDPSGLVQMVKANCQ